MRFPNEAKCHICKRLFCCSKCRQKHQLVSHAIAVRRPIHMESHSTQPQIPVMGHEPNAVKELYVFCPICEHKPLQLREKEHAELLAHIENVHLPLRCSKCLRHYTKIGDLHEFTKCMNQIENCNINPNQTYNANDSKVTLKKEKLACTTSTQTSPSIVPKQLNDTSQCVLPLSIVNLRWQAKSKITHEEFSTDSVSSIRNLSSINASTSRIIEPPLTEMPHKGKLIRSTSTPLQLVDTAFTMPKEPPTFNASNGGYMSSIYNNGFGDVDQNSPAFLTTTANNNNAQQLHQRQWKLGARCKMTAVTPLRQVMSKSIQRAFVEHGGLPGPLLATSSDHALQRRTRLDLGESSSIVHNNSMAVPLDLRLSPALRRTQSETSTSSKIRSTLSRQELNQPPCQQQILLSAHKLTTESIIITRSQLQSSNSSSNGSRDSSLDSNVTSATVYNSCRNVEIISSSSSSISATTAGAPVEYHDVPPITPITRVPGAIINKKVIKFETPQEAENGNGVLHNSMTPLAEEKEIFYTPERGTPDPNCAFGERPRQQMVPRQLSEEFSQDKKVNPPPQRPRARPPLRRCKETAAFSCVEDLNTNDDAEDAFLSIEKSNTDGNTGFWSLITSIMRLPTNLGGKSNSVEQPTSSSSLIKRCASFAGSLIRPSSDIDVMQNLKRKRSRTLENQCDENALASSSASKRLRIQPRQPMRRMQNY